MRLLPIALLCLWGCSEGPLFPGVSLRAKENALAYLNPFDGAQDVLPASPILARTTTPASEEDLKLYTEGGGEVPVTVRVSGSQITLTPNAPLDHGATYEVRFLSSRSRFTVAYGPSRSDDGLRVVSNPERVWPFSTLHILFSEPIQSASVTEASLRLTHGSTGQSVKGTVLARGNRIAFDPEGELEPGASYILALTRDIRDLSGEGLTPISRSLTVDSAPLARKVTLVLGQSGTLGALDGRPVNTLELRSSLVGTQSMQISGTLQTQMPDLATAGARIPMVIRKGQLLSRSVADPRGLPIALYNQIPTGLHSGPLTLALLTDSVGEILENATPGAQPLVRMVLDASLVAGDSTVHALLNQDLLHLQMSGLLKVEDGQLAVDLVGGAELQLMGMETAPSLVTLAAKSSDPVVVALREPAHVVGSVPAKNTLDAESDGELRLVLSAPLDSTAQVWLEREGGDGVLATSDDVPSFIRLDGSTAFLKPVAQLLPGTSYQLRFSGEAIPFRTRTLSADNLRPLMITSVRPGVPCALEGLACRSDLVAVDAAALPANFPLEIAFTQPIDLATVKLGGSIRVEQADGGTPAGRLEVRNASVRFVPDSALQVGERYTLKINTRTDVGCGPERVCDRRGVALNTDVLKDALEEAGGAPIEIAFTPTAATRASALTMGLGPIADLNANGRIDPAEAISPQNSVAMRGTDGGVAAITYLSGSLMTTVGAYDDKLGGVPVKVAPGSWMFGTSTVMYGLVTDRLVMRPAQSASGLLRRPESNDPDQRPVVSVAFHAYVDAVNDTVEQALQREPLELQLVGRLTFGAEGALVMELSNANATKLSMLQGNLVMALGVGDVRVRAVSAPLKQ
ncbi:MAG: Ig-like domain-containing protein [Myxococcaceae bacterium]